MDSVKAILTKPLDGQLEGTERKFDRVDFERLQAMGAVRAAESEELVEQDDPVEKADPEAVVTKATKPPLNKMAASPLNKSPKVEDDRD